ncbi:MAG TPA: hypothetical protein G4O03_04335 [Dehalococcoidia bacterium]|jgi:hypothetical protein|nr:hypothetical protein [Dehalococcoidia bacterium]
MGAIRGCLIALGIVFGLLVLLVATIIGYFCYTLSRPIPLEQEMTPVAISHEAALSLDRKIEALEAQIRAAQEAGVVKPIRFEVTPEEASSWAKEEIERALEEGEVDLPFNIESIQINFSPGSVIIKGMAKIKAWGFTISVGGEAEVDIRHGQLWYAIEEEKIQLAGIPGAVKEQVLEAIRAGIPHWPSGSFDITDLPLELQSIGVEDDKLVIEGQTGVEKV